MGAPGDYAPLRYFFIQRKRVESLLNLDIRSACQISSLCLQYVTLQHCFIIIQVSQTTHQDSSAHPLLYLTPIGVFPAFPLSIFLIRCLIVHILRLILQYSSLLP